MTDARKTVAIIGAGPSGLTTARSMLASSIRPTIFDIKTEVGGLWSPSYAAGIVGLNMEMPTNLSHYSCAFSDLAWPEMSKMFPAAKDVGAYLKRYQEKYIPDTMLKLGCQVTSVTRGNDKRWNVEWRGDGSGVETFDFLVVCSGFFSTPYIPPIDGLEGFAGTVLHSSEFAVSKLDLTAKRKIVVVGGSMSGVEVAADLALRVSSLPEREAENVEVVHLIPRPFWVLPKYLPASNSTDPTAPKFLPLDLVLYDFNQRLAQPKVPPKSAEENYMAANYRLKSMVGHDQYDVSPALCISDEYMRQPPWVTVSDSYVDFVRAGVIKPVNGRLSGISSTSKKTLVLEQGAAEDTEDITDVDAIALATGYHPSSSLQSIFSEDIFSALTSPSPALEEPTFLPLLLYNQSLHPAFQKTGGFVGMYKGPYFGVMELQGRWLAGLFSGKLDWPSDEEMKKGMEAFEKTRNSRIDGRQNDFRPQWSSGDYLGAINNLREHIKIDSAPSATAYSPNPMIPAHLVDSNSNADEATKALRSLKALILPSSTMKPPRFVAKAIFRSFQGKWTLSRRLDSKHPGFPSGRFTGSAEFRPRTPTFTPSPRPSDGRDPASCSSRFVQDRNPPCLQTPGEVLEYLYIEQGNFTTDTGLAMTGSRRYIYRYHPDEDAITVWFVKADGVAVDYFFHEASILATSAQQDSALGGIGAVDLAGGWKARSQHLCRLDWYWPSYRFVFRRETPDLDRFWIRYKVSGPHKDYTMEGLYRRV